MGTNRNYRVDVLVGLSIGLSSLEPFDSYGGDHYRAKGGNNFEFLGMFIPDAVSFSNVCIVQN